MSAQRDTTGAGIGTANRRYRAERDPDKQNRPKGAADDAGDVIPLFQIPHPDIPEPNAMPVIL